MSPHAAPTCSYKCTQVLNDDLPAIFHRWYPAFAHGPNGKGLVALPPTLSPALLLPWQQCQELLADYCQELEFPATAEGFVDHLRTWLTTTALEVDAGYATNPNLTISVKGEPKLKRFRAVPPRQSAVRLEALLIDRLPERSILDMLSIVHGWVPFTTPLGHVSGSEP